jgi:5-methylcytosine-specific restriction endonuclease McrA
MPPLAPKPYSVIHHEAPLPPDLSKGQTLIALYALQQWECLKQPQLSPYKPGYFYNAIQGILRGLETPSRGTALRHLATSACIACGDPVNPLRSRFDHIIPSASGGPEDLGNALVLCRPHNSSKGTRDLLDWWLWKSYDALLLPREVLCLYARIHWQHYGPEVLGEPTPPFLAAFLCARAAALPGDDYRIALIGAAFAASGFVRWLKEPPRHGT